MDFSSFPINSPFIGEARCGGKYLHKKEQGKEKEVERGRQGKIACGSLQMIEYSCIVGYKVLIVLSSFGMLTIPLMWLDSDHCYFQQYSWDYSHWVILPIEPCKSSKWRLDTTMKLSPKSSLQSRVVLDGGDGIFLRPCWGILLPSFNISWNFSYD